MTRPRHLARNAWLATMVAGFVLLTASLAWRWWPGAWAALFIGLAFSVAFWRLHSNAERERQRWHRTLDAMNTAIVLWGRDDRMQFANADFKRLYALDDAEIAAGISFERLLRRRVAAGTVPEARGREEDWIAERLAQHHDPAGTSVTRQMPDGSWRRITEQPLANGSLLSYSIDVTELVQRDHELAAARADAERLHRHLRDALEAIPAGIEIYDEADRLVVFNRRLEHLYPHVAQQMQQGQTFEAMVRRSLALGALPQAQGREEEWLAERLALRGRSAGPVLQQLADGTWLQIHETRSDSGSIVGVRLDVSELVRQREALAAAQAHAEAAQRLLADAIEAMPASIEIYDADDRLLLFNQRMLLLYPYFDAQSLAGQTFEAIVRHGLALGQIPQARGREQDWLAERLAAHAAADARPRLQQAPDGSWIHIYETRLPAGGTVVVRLDVSELIKQRDAQREARQLLDDAIEALPDGFALYDAADRLVLCNQRYREIYPASAPAMQPGASFETIVRHGLESDQYLEAGTDREAWVAERMRRHRNTDGTPLLQWVAGGRCLRIDERRTRDGGIAGVRTDVTDLMQARQAAESARAEAQAAAVALRDANAKLQTLSLTDALTGLANRRHFDERLCHELQRAQRHGMTLSLLMIDIDYFKRYNDLHGHPQGDRALVDVAAVLAQHARRPGELAARYGGEEFVILLPHADADTAQAVAARCHAGVARLALPHGQSPAAAHVTLSIGAAQWRGSSEDGASLLRRADMALYAAKGAGRACTMLAAEPN